MHDQYNWRRIHMSLSIVRNDKCTYHCKSRATQSFNQRPLCFCHSVACCQWMSDCRGYTFLKQKLWNLTKILFCQFTRPHGTGTMQGLTIRSSRVTFLNSGRRCLMSGIECSSPCQYYFEMWHMDVKSPAMWKPGLCLGDLHQNSQKRWYAF